MYYILCKPMRGKGPLTSFSFVMCQEPGSRKLRFDDPVRGIPVAFSLEQAEIFLPVVRKRFPTFRVFLG